MATVVFLHAHPDDESIATGGTIAALADAGHRVVLVLATRGELGEVPDGFLPEGETLTQRRVLEARAAAEILGAQRIAFLGYRDSGMADEATNAEPSAFWQADVEQAATRLLDLLAGESVDLLVSYDERGNYGHPDHIQVSRVGAAVARRTGLRVLEVTMNRERLQAALAASPDEVPEGEGVGMPAERIHLAVDVGPWLDRKRAAMQAHASQIPDQSFFLTMAPGVFAELLGTEWYIRHGEPANGDQVLAGGLDVFLDPAPLSAPPGPEARRRAGGDS